MIRGTLRTQDGETHMTQMDLALGFARKTFLARLKKMKVGADKYVWLIGQPLATDEERDRASQWLRTIGGWNEAQIAAIKRQRR
jgi:hypothetical protein